MPALELTLEYPPPELNPNKGTGKHWGVSQKAKEGYGGKVFVEARNAMRAVGLSATIPPPVHAVVTFLLPDKIRRYMDNMFAMTKPLWDALVRAGALLDDNVWMLSFTLGVAHGPKCVRVALYAAEEITLPLPGIGPIQTKPYI